MSESSTYWQVQDLQRKIEYIEQLLIEVLRWTHTEPECNGTCAAHKK